MSLLLAILLASPDSAHPAWMVGTWGWQNPGETVNPCGTDDTATYYPNGHYSLLDETGTWRIEGNHLIETVTDPGESGSPTSRGTSHVFRFVRVGQKALRVYPPNPGKLIKCRAG